MPDVVRQVETQFTVMDKTTAPLRAMQGAAARVTSAFDKASNMLGTFGGIAAGILRDPVLRWDWEHQYAGASGFTVLPDGTALVWVRRPK